MLWRGRRRRGIRTRNGEKEEEEEEEEEEEMDGLSLPSVLPEKWDVLGLGQAMVDFSGMVDDEFLEMLGLEKRKRKVVNHEESGRVLRAMDGCIYKAPAGGSLLNTLVPLGRLGCKPIEVSSLNVAMAGRTASDPLGGFYRTKLGQANVNFVSSPVKDGTTGTVIFLTTPDAQRTMLACPVRWVERLRICNVSCLQGTSSTINYDPCLAGIVSKTSILAVEGYLFELPDTIKTITNAFEEACRSGVLVAVTASDVSCIERHYDDFCLQGISVTDGPRGSDIGVRGEAAHVTPSPRVPIVARGAGDAYAYASGILYSILRGLSDFKRDGAR